MDKKISKIAIAIILFLGIVFLGSSAHAFIFRPDGYGYFATSTIDENKTFCMNIGGHLKDNTLLPGLYQGKTTSDGCSYSPPTKPEVSTKGGDVAYTSEYTSSTPIMHTSYQDTAYSLAFGKDYYQEDVQEQINKIIWQTDLNIPRIWAPDEIDRQEKITFFDRVNLYEEARAYREFYEEKEASGGFITSDDTDYDELQVSVNQSDDTYIIGRFSIDYSKGIYKSPTGRVVKFGWINDMKLRDQDGRNLKIVDILDEDGKSIKDRKDYKYPDNGEEFYIKFKYDGKGKASKVQLEVEFKYLDECYAQMNQWDGTIYEWGWAKEYTGGVHHHNCDEDECNRYSEYHYKLQKAPYQDAQTLLVVTPIGDDKLWAQPRYEKDYLETEWRDITMDLGGIVFFDNTSGKPGTVNGEYNEAHDGDYGLENIEVTLYESNGKLAELAPFDEDIHEDEDRPRTNPTLTDSNGYYEFKGIDAQKKYYVVFKFNGQEYENTACNINTSSYNGTKWEKTSKASIDWDDRVEYNSRFEKIASSPDNYSDVQSKITGFGMSKNRTFTPSESEKARKELYRRIREYMEDEEKYPEGRDLKDIYEALADDYGEDLVQFIVDTEVTARTGTDTNRQLFPLDSKFTIDINDNEIGRADYDALYDGLYYINLGLMQREKLDLNLKKDLYEATVVINNKTYTYQYNSRDGEKLEIDIRGTDIAPYGDNRNFYEREIRESDIQYIDYSNNGPERLRIYLTYRIRIYNSSNGDITTYVNSIYDYYDSDYTYVNSYNNPKDKAGTQIGWTQQGESGTNLKKMITTDDKVSGRALKSGAYEDIYVEYEVNTDAIKRLLSEKESTKENYAEIGSYSSYYTNTRYYANSKKINDAGFKAGLIDVDSRPGNFDPTNSKVKDFVAYTYTEAFQKKTGAEKTAESRAIFEDDADKAPGIKLKLLEDVRKLNGTVWEDENVVKTLKDQNIRVGDGINNENQLIKKMKVEVLDSDRGNKILDIYNPATQKFEPAVTYTDDNGNYYFNGYVPGNYIVRFTYGEGETLTKTANGKVYNGQDYKSTLYDETFHTSWNENTPNYWYANENDNKSDAQDDLNLRNTLNKTKTGTMTNHIANVLNYQAEAGKDDKGWLPELQERAQMNAYTTPLVLEVEYAKQTSIYQTNVREYEVSHVDFGITERPRSELTLTKDIENIRVITTSGQALFDAKEQGPNIAWIKPQINPAGTDVIGKVQITIEENLIYGSTIKVLYRFTVENTGERDYVNSDGTMNKKFYNTGVPEGEIVRTNIDTILDYVENNLNFGQSLEEEKQYNKNWTTIALTELQKKNNDSLVDDSIDISSYRTFIINTNNSPLTTKLAPANKRGEKGETATDTLLLTKIMQSADASEDDLTYDNSAEIVKSSNMAGRRSYQVKDRTNVNKDEIAECIVSIPGDFNPKTLANLEEPDSDIAETIVVLPPFGENRSTYYIIGGIILIAILGVGIYLIKKKVN